MSWRCTCCGGYYQDGEKCPDAEAERKVYQRKQIRNLIQRAFNLGCSNSPGKLKKKMEVLDRIMDEATNVLTEE